VHATGGAVASPLWTGVLAAALDRPVRLAASPEGTGLGACLLGLHALGEIDDLDAATRLVQVGTTIGPEPGAAATYARTRPLVEQAVEALTDVLAALDGGGA
jgi:gluconokinase